MFQEYINSKGKTVEKAPVDIKGGKPDPATPPQSPPKQKNPYIAKGGKKAKNGSEKGFADMGDKILKYQPKVGCTMEQIKLSKKVIRNLESNPLFAEQLVHEFKKSGTLATILAEMLQHKATYNCISEVMSHQKYGPVVCNKLVRAMNEQTAPGFSKDSSGLEDDTDVLQNGETDNLQDSDEFNGEGMEDDDDELSDDELDDDDEVELKDDPDEEDEELEKDMENPEGMGDEENMEEMPLDAPMGSPGQPGMPAMSGQMPDQPMPGAETPQGMPPAMHNFRQAMMRRW